MIELSRIEVAPGDWLRWAAPFAAPPENLTIEFPNITVLDRNSCSACQSTLLLFLQKHREKLFDYFSSDGPIHIAIGKGHADLPEGTLCLGNCTINQRERHLCSRLPAGRKPDSTGDRGRLNPPEFPHPHDEPPGHQHGRVGCIAGPFEHDDQAEPGTVRRGIAGKPGVFLIFNPVSAVPVLPAQLIWMESPPSYAVPRGSETVRRSPSRIAASRPGVKPSIGCGQVIERLVARILRGGNRFIKPRPARIRGPGAG